MDDHRIAPRSRALKAATIIFNGGGIDCVVRNVSETGAQLEVVSPVGIPERFVLVIQGSNTSHPCRVVWRKTTRLGVTYEPAE